MTELTVMTFNMKRSVFKFGRHAWNRREPLVAQMVRRLEPDILGTQELTRSSLADLCRLLPEYSYAGIGRGGGAKGEYTAIFYRTDRFDLLSYETFWLSRTPNRPSRDATAFFARTCTWCELAQKEDPERPLRVYNTHLDHISYFARVRGLGLIAQEIFKRYEEAPGPVVLMGDFNAAPNSKTLKKWAGSTLREDGNTYLLNSYNVLAQMAPEQSLGRSYHGWRDKAGGKPIDYIFTTKDVVLKKVDILRDKVGDAFPSDHYPVLAKIEY